MFRPQEIIRKKRDGGSLTEKEIANFVGGVTDGRWADYQISALLMACFTRGLNSDEQAFLTGAMLHSGDVLDFSDIEAPKADKHSTGGVGDKTSLIIAPLAAACGIAVPMISGRGLGHTGGTLDKLESIKGYNVNLSLEEFKTIVKSHGFAMCGQTPEIAPADKKLYALRDATSTVEYIPLIVASIMSKKLAEGLDALVLDVKTGSGAFMTEFEDSCALGKAMAETGYACRVKTQAVVTDMNQPLGKYVGNALEVYECIKILRGEMEAGFEATLELSLDLTARMLSLTKIAVNLKNARKICEEKLRDGSALEKFRQNIEIQGGDAKVADEPEHLLERNLLQVPVKAANTGFITAVDVRAVGEAVSAIGGGRIKVEDRIDFGVGFACEKKIGDEIKTDEPLGVLYCRDKAQAARAGETLRKAFQIGEERAAPLSLIKASIP
ncbi:MAG TPA: thymidine phosphorylase [Pyrinomonadaceae bacterium]|jgi:pyrimidine-nucleoside phosphorylase